MNVYDFKVKDNEGNDFSLEQYRGKVSLIVNTATKCGFTPQYDGLETLYKNYKEQGFEILDFPCNQFANQAPGDSEEIHEFCTLNFGIEFKQFAKIDVNGENEDPLFTHLKSQLNILGSNKIKWNFTKFLVDRDGKVVKRFSPMTKPEKIEQHIQKLLK